MEKILHSQFVRQPKFFKDFHFIGGKCKVSCCQFWSIDYENSDVEKLKNADCSECLKTLISDSFEPYKDKMRIKLKDNGDCPFHNEEGLCSIQKELGEEYLSQICITYPRISLNVGGYVLKSCNITCPQVLSMICSDDNSMELENYSLNGNVLEYVQFYSELDLINNPELKYVSILFEFFYEILSDRSHSFETSVALGAMAAQKLDEFIKQGKYDRIPEVIKALRPQLKNQAQIDKLEQFKPNITLKANFAAGLLKFLNNSDVYQNIFENGVPSEEKINKGIAEFEKCYKGSVEYIRNIALNLYITNKMPFRKKSFSLFENYSWFVSEISVIKFLIPAIAVEMSPANEKVAEAISIIDRSFTHNDVKFKLILEYMKAFKCTSPAYLLGIIK